MPGPSGDAAAAVRGAGEGIVTITHLRPVHTRDLPESIATQNSGGVFMQPSPKSSTRFTARQTIVGLAIVLIAPDLASSMALIR